MVQQFLKNSTNKVNEIFQAAISEAVNAQAKILVPEFILMAMLEKKDSLLFDLANEQGLDPISLKTKIIDGALASVKRQDQEEFKLPKADPRQPPGLYGSPEIGFLFERADAERKKFGDTYISLPTLFLAFFESRLHTKDILERAGLNLDACRKTIHDLHGNNRVSTKEHETQQSALSEFTKDLTAMARRGELDPVTSREDEIERLIQIISRRKKNNPVLIGEPGVGKSVIVEGLAQRMIAQEVPDHLIGKKILSLEIADIVAGAKMHGEFEERLKALKEEIIAAEGQVILFIDEIHTVVGAGRTTGALDASNILKNALAKGQLQCIGATTFKEYKRYIESDSALERRFQPIKVAEPSPENAKKMLRHLIPRYEEHHKINYSSESIDAAVDLSHRYIFDRSLPDKAIDLIDEAGALKRIQSVSLPPDIQKLEKEKSEYEEKKSRYFSQQDFAKVAEVQMDIVQVDKNIEQKRLEWEKQIKPEDKIVTEQDIRALISKTTGIPVQKLKSEDYSKLKNIEEELGRRVIGQKKAVEAVADALRRNRVGLRARKAPIGSFLFLGPTGVGKTELAKALAEYVLNDESRLIRFDMSEYMERHESAKLVGSPPGYVGYGEGGQLTEKIRRQPNSVLLFDEIEKAHPDVFNMFLQILDDGRLTDAEGQTINFENTLIIFTSNIGSEHISQNKRSVGLRVSGDDELSNEEVEGLVHDELKKVFKPELLNRLDEVIVFHKLHTEEIGQIFELHEKRLAKHVHDTYGITLHFSKEARDWLIMKGTDPVYGARPLRRTIEHYVENEIAQEIINSNPASSSPSLKGKVLTIEFDPSVKKCKAILS